jgi:hypothetical protein
LDFLTPILAYLKEKNFDPYLVDFLLFGDQKCHFQSPEWGGGGLHKSIQSCYS